MSVIRAIALSVCVCSATCCLALAVGLGIKAVVTENPQGGLLSTTTSLNTLDSVYQATVKVTARDRQWGGSGIAGTYRGMFGVLTAAHVVAGDDQHDVIWENTYREDEVSPALVVAVDNENDLAWLMVPWTRSVGPDLTPCHNMKLGETAWYCGYGARTPKWLERSLVARPVYQARDPWSFTGFLVTGRGYYGSSGGPVLVERQGKCVLAGVMSHWATQHEHYYGLSPLAAVGPDSVAKFLDKVVREHGCSH